MVYSERVENTRGLSEFEAPNAVILPRGSFKLRRDISSAFSSVLQGNLGVQALG